MRDFTHIISTPTTLKAGTILILKQEEGSERLNHRICWGQDPVWIQLRSVWLSLEAWTLSIFFLLILLLLYFLANAKESTLPVVKQ